MIEGAEKSKTVMARNPFPAPSGDCGFGRFRAAFNLRFDMVRSAPTFPAFCRDKPPLNCNADRAALNSTKRKKPV
jgi:hypothetical protein